MNALLGKSTFNPDSAPFGGVVRMLRKAKIRDRESDLPRFTRAFHACAYAGFWKVSVDLPCRRAIAGAQLVSNRGAAFERFATYIAYCRAADLSWHGGFSP